MKRLEGKVAIITGASQGLGTSIVRAFAREGACVVGTARREAVVQQVMDEVAAEFGVQTLSVRHDVGNRSDWEAVVAATVEKFGRVDILVNNAGRTVAHDILATTEDEFIDIYRTNTLSIVLGIQTVAPEFEKIGRGSVVNVNSLAGIVSGDADGMSAAYSASKDAGRSLSKHAAYYLAPKNIRVNTVHPGPIMTPLLKESLEASPEIAARVEQYNPLPPHVSGPEDIAEAVLYLASDEARCVTGAELVVDCGHLVM